MIDEDPITVELSMNAGGEDPPEWSRAGWLRGSLKVRNRSDRSTDLELLGRIEDNVLFRKTLRLPAGETLTSDIEVPVEAMNRGCFLDVDVHRREGKGDAGVMRERFPLEIPVPLQVEIVHFSLQEGRLTLKNLFMQRAQRFHLAAEVEGEQVLDQAVTLTPAQSLELPFRWSGDWKGRQARIDIRAQWPADEFAVPGCFTLALDFRELRGIPSRIGSTPSERLGKSSGLFPADRRAALEGKDDLEVAFRWAREEGMLILEADCKDDHHFNRQEGPNLWNGDSLQVGLGPPAGPLTSLVLALASGQARLHVFTGLAKEKIAAAEHTVVRDETARITRYRLQLPLEACGIPPAKGGIFRMNLVVFDDDTGEGYAYWRQLSPGLAGGVKFNQFPLFFLEDP